MSELSRDRSKRLLFVAASIVALAAPASGGTLQICKKDSQEDWGIDLWKREIVIPAGAVFGDVGPIGDVTGAWLKLRIMTLTPLRLKGADRCGKVEAVISGANEDWGRKHEGAVVDRVRPADKRLLEIVRVSDASTPTPRTMFPWASVVPVEATVLSEIAPR